MRLSSRASTFPHIPVRFISSIFLLLFLLPLFMTFPSISRPHLFPSKRIFDASILRFYTPSSFFNSSYSLFESPLLPPFGRLPPFFATFTVFFSNPICKCVGVFRIGGGPCRFYFRVSLACPSSFRDSCFFSFFFVAPTDLQVPDCLRIHFVFMSFFPSFPFSSCGTLTPPGSRCGPDTLGYFRS